MITVIKTKPNHPVHRKKRQGGTHQHADSDCVPCGNLFSPFLCFLYFKKCACGTRKMSKTCKKKEPKKDKT